MKPLEGKIILDLTHMLSGPYGTMLLTDLGARTIKVEPPGRGEGTRELLRNDANYSRNDMGAYYLTLNRGKESVSLDLKSDAGREVFYDLVRQADIVFDNFAVGVTKRLRIDHATLAGINPRIITCSVTGFGETGPDNERPAFDLVVQAMGGGMSITGPRGGAPLRSGIPVGDLGGGVFGAIGVLAALAGREVTGKGQHVDISMLDAQVSLLNYMATMHLMSGLLPERIGNEHFVHVPYNTYPTKDGYIMIACIGDAFYQCLLEVFDHPELHKPEYRKQPARLAAKEQIDAILGEALRHKTSAEWELILRAARVPCGPVNDFAQALNDPQIKARAMVVEVPLPGGGTVRMPGNPVKLSDTAGQPDAFTAPPRLGEQTDSVLAGLLSYPPERIAALRASSAIA
jgi:crotonobetainyl-CoA:carnitine CoA-transferase CaiB-like acyl-CoA transferase